MLALAYEHMAPKAEKTTMPDLIQQRLTLGVVATAFVILLGSVASGAWWCANVSARLDALATAVNEAGSDRYTGKDAARDIRDRDRMIVDLQQQLNAMKSQIDIIALNSGRGGPPH